MNVCMYICTDIYLSVINRTVCCFSMKGFFLITALGLWKDGLRIKQHSIKDQQKITKHIGQVGQVFGDLRLSDVI